jgi:hypothetical protein
MQPGPIPARWGWATAVARGACPLSLLVLLLTASALAQPSTPPAAQGVLVRLSDSSLHRVPRGLTVSRAASVSTPAPPPSSTCGSPRP